MRKALKTKNIHIVNAIQWDDTVETRDRVWGLGVACTIERGQPTNLLKVFISVPTGVNTFLLGYGDWIGKDANGVPHVITSLDASKFFDLEVLDGEVEAGANAAVTVEEQPKKRGKK